MCQLVAVVISGQLRAVGEIIPRERAVDGSSIVRGAYPIHAYVNNSVPYVASTLRRGVGGRLGMNWRCVRACARARERVRVCVRARARLVSHAHIGAM